MATIDKILRTENGGIQLLDASDNILQSVANSQDFEMIQNGTDVVNLTKGGNLFARLIASDVTRLEVQPDPETAFSGDAQDLIAELSANFFFDVTGGGGGIGDVFSVTAQSVGVAQVVAATIVVPAQSVYTIRVFADGKKVAADNFVQIQNNVTAYCNTAGTTVTSMGTAPVTRNGGFTVGQIPQLVLQNVADTIQIRVSSTVVQTVNWNIKYEIISTTFNA